MPEVLRSGSAARYATDMTQTVHLLTIGAYDDRQVVGIYATHGAAEAALLAEATSGEWPADMLQAAEITQHTVQS